MHRYELNGRKLVLKEESGIGTNFFIIRALIFT